ncbi:MAG: sugar ABC transporter substrate-binding protein [Spirulinaceae cyanobacterium SM2_1_0]|nr:sugar ABC transporter substrate-binding protein [Spirulinaceae cyanobacterium SM2_1_0]
MLAHAETSVAQLPQFEPVPVSLPTNASYTLGAGDRVRIDIFIVPEYSDEYPVLVDGTLNLPLVGTVSVQDLTLEQAATRLADRYREFLVRPIVTVGLVSPRPVKLAIAGEVRQPGSYTVNLDGNRQFPTITEVIGLAAGVTLAADVRQIEIRRNYQGTPQTFSVDLWNLLREGDLSQDIVLRDGDQVFIPTATEIDAIATRQLADASFAPGDTAPFQIAVVGEVTRPGSYTVGADSEEPPTVTRAITVAGGIAPTADVRRLRLRRTTRDGTIEEVDIDLWQLLQAGDLSQDPLLQAGDTILIPEAAAIDVTEAQSLATANFSPDTIRVNVVGEVVSGGTQELPPNTPLNQALLAAGGFNNRARRSSIELIRLNTNGTVSKREIEVDLASNVNPEDNPVLLNNDIVIVNRSALSSVSDALGAVLAPVGGFFSFINFFNIFDNLLQ